MKQLIVTLIVALTGAAFLPAQSPTPAASASPSPKHTNKKAEAKASPSPSATAKSKAKTSPAPAANAKTSPAAVTDATAPVIATHGKVWVNTETHVYHMEGSRFYGKTKNGKYMTEAEARAEGDRPSANGD